jgi:hypothetical protein
MELCQVLPKKRIICGFAKNIKLCVSFAKFLEFCQVLPKIIKLCVSFTKFLELCQVLPKIWNYEKFCQKYRIRSCFAKNIELCFSIAKFIELCQVLPKIIFI